MCDVEIPENAVLLNVLHVVEYLDGDDIFKVDLSHDNAGGDMEVGKQLELIEWARAFTMSPLLAEMIHDYVHDEDDDEGEEVPA